MENILPRIKLTNILFVIALGVIVAAALFQAERQGFLPKTNLPKPISNETRTVVQEENTIISVVEKVSSSVVAIGVTQKVVNPFDPFAIPRSQESTIGTGFVVSDERSSPTGKGIIVTNKHVVSQSGSKYSVLTKDEEKYEVKRIYRDPVLDLAILEIDPNGLSALELGDSSKLKVGQTAIAIGNALGRLTNTVTTGIISGLGRKVVAGDAYGSTESLDNLIQTDAAINPGNSGGPLLNSAGQVIGVNVATTEGAQNIGFAIPINAVKSIVDEFVTKGSVTRPYLGIRYRFITRDVAILNEVPQGAYIQEVMQGGPADKAGVKAGDIITKIGGQDIDEENEQSSSASQNKVSEIVAKGQIGNKLDLTVWRDGKEIKLQATLEELPNE